MQIVPRAGWEARPPRSQYRPGFTNETFLHHSVGYGQGGAAYMRQMQDQHMAPGWAGTVNGGSDIAYNHVIDPRTLTVYEGRGWGVAPGAQKNHNTGTWAVCVMGDYRTDQTTPGLVSLIAELIRYGHESGHLPLELTGGHRDAPGQSTTCPGDKLHVQIPFINQELQEVEVVTEQDKIDIANLAADEVLARQFSDPTSTEGGTRTVANFIVQGYGLTLRAVRGAERAASQTTREKLVEAAKYAGAGVAGGGAVAIVDEITRRLAGG